MSTDYNKAAFPVLERGGNGLELTDPGMTLRDYFAIHTEEPKLTHRQAEVLLGKFNGSLHEPDGTTSLEYSMWFEDAKAKFRYLKADAMLKAREAK